MSALERKVAVKNANLRFGAKVSNRPKAAVSIPDPAQSAELSPDLGQCGCQISVE
jgi:hypothetical protein